MNMGAAAGDGLVSFGRIHPDKGTAEAIAIAHASGRRLVIGGIIQDARYFEEQVEPHIDGDRVTYVGPVGSADRAEVFPPALTACTSTAIVEPTSAGTSW